MRRLVANRPRRYFHSRGQVTRQPAPGKRERQPGFQVARIRGRPPTPSFSNAPSQVGPPVACLGAAGDGQGWASPAIAPASTMNAEARMSIARRAATATQSRGSSRPCSKAAKARWVNSSGESQIVRGSGVVPPASRANGGAESYELPRVVAHRHAATRQRAPPPPPACSRASRSAPAIRCIVSHDGAA